MNKEIILVKMQALQCKQVMGFNALRFLLWFSHGARVISIFLPFVYVWGSPITLFNIFTQDWLGILLILLFCIPEPIYSKISALFSFRRLLEALFEILFVLVIGIYFFIKMEEVSDLFIGRVYSFFASQEAMFFGAGAWLFLATSLFAFSVKCASFRFRD